MYSAFCEIWGIPRRDFSRYRITGRVDFKNSNLHFDRRVSEYNRPYAFVMSNIALNAFRHIILRNFTDDGSGFYGDGGCH